MKQTNIKGGADLNIQDIDGLTPLHRGIMELGENPNKPAEEKQKILACIFEMIDLKSKLNLVRKKVQQKKNQ